MNVASLHEHTSKTKQRTRAVRASTGRSKSIYAVSLRYLGGKRDVSRSGHKHDVSPTPSDTVQVHRRGEVGCGRENCAASTTDLLPQDPPWCTGVFKGSRFAAPSGRRISYLTPKAVHVHFNASSSVRPGLEQVPSNRHDEDGGWDRLGLCIKLYGIRSQSASVRKPVRE